MEYIEFVPLTQKETQELEERRGIDWTYFWSTELENYFYKYFNHKAPSYKASPYISVWVKRVRKVDHTTAGTSLLRFDCKKRTICTLQEVKYDNKGEVIDSYDNPLGMHEKYIVPDTIGEILYNIACKITG